MRLAQFIEPFEPADGPPPRTLGAFLKWCLHGGWPALTLAVMLGPVAAGLYGTVTSSFGHLPAAGAQGPDLAALSPFAPNAAMVFVPADNTLHGFEPRTIPGVRKSLIINYVTDEWRAREQLAFQDQPIRH